MSYYLLIIASTCAPPPNAVKLATLLGLAARPAREACPRADPLEAVARGAGAGVSATGAEVNSRACERGLGERPARGQRLEPATTSRQRAAWTGAERTRPGTRDEIKPEERPRSREGQSQDRQNRQASGRLRDAPQQRARDRAAGVATKQSAKLGARGAPATSKASPNQRRPRRRRRAELSNNERKKHEETRCDSATVCGFFNIYLKFLLLLLRLV